MADAAPAPAPARPAEPAPGEPTPLSDVWAKDCRVRHVTVLGASRTKDYVVLREIEPVVHARTLEEVKDALLEASARLHALGIFRGVDILADKSETGGPHTSDLTVTVKEKSVVSANTGTYVQGDEGSVEATVRLNNPLGHAETVEVVAAAGSQHSSTLAVTAVAQRLWGTQARGELRLGQTTRSFQRHSSFTEQLRGVAATVAEGRHSWTYDLAWRSLADPSRCASASIREGLGHSLKSAAKYTYFWDGRDSDLWPQQGAALRCAAELAGLGPGGRASAHHVRLDAEGQACMPLGVFGAAAVVTGRWGALLPVSGGPSHISDRFFLGGSDSLRGFARSGAGPTDQRRPPPEGAPVHGGDVITRDALGGNLLLSGCAAVTFPIPLDALRDTSVHGHCFLQCGTLLPLAATPLAEVASSMRLAAGLGVVLPTRLGRLEVNYCVPVKWQAHDRLRHGLQVGLRTESL